MSFYEDVKNLTILASEDKPCFNTILQNSIRTAAISGKSKEVFNLKEHKVLTKEEILDLANLIEEGFNVDLKLDLTAQEYPSLSVCVNWEGK